MSAGSNLKDRARESYLDVVDRFREHCDKRDVGFREGMKAALTFVMDGRGRRSLADLMHADAKWPAPPARVRARRRNES